MVCENQHVRWDEFAHGEQMFELLARMLHERFEFQRRPRHIAGLFQGLIAYAPVGLELHVGVDADFEVPLD